MKFCTYDIPIVEMSSTEFDEKFICLVPKLKPFKKNNEDESNPKKRKERFLLANVIIKNIVTKITYIIVNNPCDA